MAALAVSRLVCAASLNGCDLLDDLEAVELILHSRACVDAFRLRLIGVTAQPMSDWLDCFITQLSQFLLHPVAMWKTSMEVTTNER